MSPESSQNHFVARALFRSDLVTVYDHSCRPNANQNGPEECANVSEILFPRSGTFLARVEGREFVADPNQMLFFNQSEVYRIMHPYECQVECTAFDFRSDILQEAVSANGGEKPSNRPFKNWHALSQQSVFHLLHQLRQSFLAAHEDASQLEEWSLTLLAAVMGSSNAGPPNKPARRSVTERAHRELAMRACLVLSANYERNLGLDNLALSVGSSPFHLARVFHGKVGLSMNQYRNRLRVRVALGRLLQGEADLARLAVDLGFASHSHFCDVFHKIVGVTPSECRRRADSRWLKELSKNLEAIGGTPG